MAGRWIEVFYDHSLDLPNTPSCYVIYIDGVLSYVGSTSDLKARWNGHQIEVRRYSSWIRRLKPRFNIMHLRPKEVANGIK